MKVLRGFSTHLDQPLTSPFLDSNGLFIEFRGGDFCDPIDGGQWFGPKYPKRILRFFLKYQVLPFISYRIGKRAGYIGAKAYGVDSEAYKNWMPEGSVYKGSQALCFSMRPFATMKD